MRTLTIALFILFVSVQAHSQIPSAEERMRRGQNNSREAVTIEQVIANRFDIGDKPFLFVIKWSRISQLKQIEANRWEIAIGGQDGSYKAMANFPRGGAEAIGTIKDGDVVIARIKPNSDIVVEILGISEVNKWE